MSRIDEETTMSSITYLPSGLGGVRTAIKQLARLKKQWGIEILDEKEGKNVVFEDSLSVFVPLQYWNDFTKLFEMPLDRGIVELDKYLKEAMDEDLCSLRNQVKFGLTKLFDDKVFRDVDKSINSFRSYFGTNEYKTADVAIKAESKEKDIRKLTTKLLNTYQEDRGNLELLIEVMLNKESLNTFDIFKNFDFLYGTRVYTKYRRTGLTFEIIVDFTYLVNQSILIEDEVVLDKLRDEPAVKVVNNGVFPKDDFFTGDFFRLLRNLIKDILD